MRRRAATPERPAQAFDAGGELLLLAPSALDQVWPPFCAPVEEDERPYEREGALAIVEVDGPLDQRGAGWWWQGYDTVARDVCAALADPQVGAVALRIDSPGGDVAGCFEACDLIAKAKAAAGKKIVCLVDECACSAAYALASVADEILLPPSAEVGSVGVVLTYLNRREAMEKEGYRVAVLTSGKDKALGSSLRPWSDEALGKLQGTVDYLAGLFFDLVSKNRRMTTDAVKALEASTFRGQAAVAAGLADRIMPTADALTYARTVAEQARAAGRGLRPLFPVRASAASPPGHLMKSVALTLGLSEEASEAEILAAIVKQKGASDELLALTGKATQAEAVGAVRGLVETAKAYDVLVTQRATEQKAAREAAVETIFASAVASGRRTPAQVEAAKKSIEAKTLVLDTDEKVAAYRAEIEASPVVLPPAPAAGGPRPSGDGPLVGKPWEEMSRGEKHRLMNDNPAAYKAMKADAERRNHGKR